jgi:hypothetical protein
MGTRGAYGFRNNGQDKVTYNHYDSYPSYLGRNILKYVALTSPEEIRLAAKRIILVDPESKPTPVLIEKYSHYADINVATHNLSDWYCLLRNAQGEIQLYSQGLRHMIDGHEFLRDSLFCEWAYILNTDSEVCEVYRGFNKDWSARGRYASLRRESASEYYGVALLDEIPFDEIKLPTLDKLVQRIEKKDRRGVTVSS